VAGVAAYSPRAAPGQLGEREPRARTDAAGTFRLQTLLTGPARVCLSAPAPWVRTTLRCQVVRIDAGADLGPLVFGFDQFGSRCPGGGVIDTIVAVSAAGGPASPPALLPGPARGPWAGSRLNVPSRGAPVVFARLGDRLHHLLVLDIHPAVSRPVVRLTVAPGRERVVSVKLADGTPATNLGRGRRLPSPRPTAFSYFDQRGEILIFAPPRLADGRGYEDILIVTDTRTHTAAFTYAARLDGSVRVDGRNLPTCRDSSHGRGFSVRP
jgi:hypothetical protein